MFSIFARPQPSTGTPESEIPRAEIVVEEHAPEFYRPAPPIPDDEAAVATVSLQIGATYLQKGRQRVRRDAPFVKGNEQYFVTVPVRLSEIL